nr:hypothetical protein [Salmonid herpesvirus 1]
MAPVTCTTATTKLRKGLHQWKVKQQALAQIPKYFRVRFPGVFYVTNHFDNVAISSETYRKKKAFFTKARMAGCKPDIKDNGYSLGRMRMLKSIPYKILTMDGIRRSVDLETLLVPEDTYALLNTHENEYAQTNEADCRTMDMNIDRDERSAIMILLKQRSQASYCHPVGTPPPPLDIKTRLRIFSEAAELVHRCHSKAGITIGTLSSHALGLTGDLRLFVIDWYRSGTWEYRNDYKLRKNYHSHTLPLTPGKVTLFTPLQADLWGIVNLMVQLFPSAATLGAVRLCQDVCTYQGKLEEMGALERRIGCHIKSFMYDGPHYNSLRDKICAESNILE